MEKFSAEIFIKNYLGSFNSCEHTRFCFSTILRYPLRSAVQFVIFGLQKWRKNLLTSYFLTIFAFYISRTILMDACHLIGA